MIDSERCTVLFVSMSPPPQQPPSPSLTPGANVITANSSTRRRENISNGEILETYHRAAHQPEAVWRWRGSLGACSLASRGAANKFGPVCRCVSDVDPLPRVSYSLLKTRDLQHMQWMSIAGQGYLWNEFEILSGTDRDIRRQDCRNTRCTRNSYTDGVEAISKIYQK